VDFGVPIFVNDYNDFSPIVNDYNVKFKLLLKSIYENTITFVVICLKSNNFKHHKHKKNKQRFNQLIYETKTTLF